MNPLFYSIKLIGIAYAGVVVFIVATILSSAFRNALDSLGIQNGSSTFLLMFVSFISILAYITRRVAHRVPFPLNGVAGYDHERLKELNGGVVIAFALYAVHDDIGSHIRNNPLVRRMRGFMKR